MVRRTSAAPAGPAASVSVATGRISSSEIATGTPSSWTRAGARQDPHQPVELGRQQHAAVRRAAAALEQRVRAQIHLLDLQPRRLGRVGEPARQRAAERRFAAVRLDQHAREPQSALAAREPVADPRDRALGRRGRLLPSAPTDEIAAAATCSHGLTRAGQSHSDSFSVG